MQGLEKLMPALFASLLAAAVCLAWPGAALSGGSAEAASARKVATAAKVSRMRHRPPRIALPIGPAYIYHDYPYYYSRGYYPTHIGGYVYYPANDGRLVSRRPAAACAEAKRGCVAGWRSTPHPRLNRRHTR